MTVAAALALARTFRLPLPPPVNERLQRGTTFGGRRNMHLTTPARAWAQGAATVVGAWHPPKRTPLTVRIILEIPESSLRRFDADGFIKPLLDATVGPRADQWVDDLHVSKRVGDGWAEVWIAPYIPMHER